MRVSVAAGVPAEYCGYRLYRGAVAAVGGECVGRPTMGAGGDVVDGQHGTALVREGVDEGAVISGDRIG